MSGSPVSSGRRAGGWRRLRRIDSGGPSETQQRTAPQREFITLDNDDEESEEICNTCPLCKQTVRQLRHWGPDGPPRAVQETPAGPLPHQTVEGSRESEKGGVKVERKEGPSDAAEERWQSSAEEGDAAATWDVIQFQRASNLRQRRQRSSVGGGGGGRGSATFFHQLSLEASPAPLSDSLQALTAFSTQQPSRVTRSMMRMSQDSLTPSQSSIQTSQNPPTKAPPTRRSTSQPLSPPPPPSSSSSSPSSPGPLVVSIPDRLQRVSYAEDDIPSPSILNICCERCHTDVDEDRLLLCDGCDEAYHTYCLIPPLICIPDDEWFCPQCQLEESLRLEEEHMRVQMGERAAEVLSQTPPRRTTLSPRRPRSQQRRRRLRPTSPRPPPVFAPYEEEDGEEEEEDDAKDVNYSHPSRRAERTAKRASRRVEELRTANLHRQRQQHEEARLRSQTHNNAVTADHTRPSHQRVDQRLTSQRPRPPSTFPSSSLNSSSSPSSSFSSSVSSLQLLPPGRTPSSSLARLSSGGEEALPTLAARMRELQLQKQREREAQKAQEVLGWMQHGIVETLLDEAVRARDSTVSPHSHNGRSVKRQRGQRDDELGKGDGDGREGGGNRVRRKMPRKAPNERAGGRSQNASPSPSPALVSFASLRGGAPPATSPQTSTSGISWHSLHSSSPPPTAPLKAQSHSVRVEPPHGRSLAVTRTSPPTSSLSRRPSSSLASLPSTSPSLPPPSLSPAGRGGGGTTKSSTRPPSLPPSAASSSTSSSSSPFPSVSRGLVPQLSDVARGSAVQRIAGPSVRPSTGTSPSAPSLDAIPSFEEFLQHSSAQQAVGRLSRSPYRSAPSPTHLVKSHQPQSRGRASDPPRSQLQPRGSSAARQNEWGGKASLLHIDGGGGGRGGRGETSIAIPSVVSLPHSTSTSPHGSRGAGVVREFSEYKRGR